MADMMHTPTHTDRENATDGVTSVVGPSPRGANGGGLPVERANLDDHIYARIKAMIVDGTLLPGERVVPEQLARDMDVSRTPTLSALKRLSQERLITWRSRRGVFVRRLSKRELAMIFEVREVLEGLATRRAATLITPPQVERLHALFADIDPTDTPANRRAYMSPGLPVPFGHSGDRRQPAAHRDDPLGQHSRARLRGWADQVDPGRVDRARGHSRCAVSARSW